MGADSRLLSAKRLVCSKKHPVSQIQIVLKILLNSGTIAASEDSEAREIDGQAF